MANLNDLEQAYFSGGNANDAAATFYAKANRLYAPADHGLLAWAYDPATAVNSSSSYTAGTVQTVRMKLNVSTSITNICLFAVTAGSTLTSGQNFAALYQGTTLIGVTADQTTNWASSGQQIMALASGPFTVAAGDIIVAFFANGTTLPAFSRASGNTGLHNFNITGTAARFGTADAGRTTTMPTPLGAMSNSTFSFWAGVS